MYGSIGELNNESVIFLPFSLVLTGIYAKYDYAFIPNSSLDSDKIKVHES